MNERYYQLGFLTVAIALIAARLVAAEPPITAVTFAPGGDKVVACSQSGVHIYDWPSLKRLKTFQAKAANLHCLKFSPDKKTLAVGGGVPAEEGTVELFAWPEGKAIATFGDHSDCVQSLVWVNDSEILTASIDRDLKLWNVNDSQKPVAIFQGHSREANAVCLINKGNTIVSSGVDQSLRIWSRTTKKLTRSLSQHTKPVNALAVRPFSAGDLPMVASAAGDRTIRFWQPTIGRMVRYIRLDAEPLDITWLSDTLIAAACVDGVVRIVDAEEVTVVQTTPALKGWAYCLACHPNGKEMVVAGEGGYVIRVKQDPR